MADWSAYHIKVAVLRRVPHPQSVHYLTCLPSTYTVKDWTAISMAYLTYLTLLPRQGCSPLEGAPSQICPLSNLPTLYIYSEGLDC